MSDTIKAKVEELGLTLPNPSPAAGTYTPFVVTGNLVFISGQVPLNADGLQYQGKVGDAYDVETAQEAARLCALNILSQLSAAIDGDLSRVKRCVKLGGFVNSTPDFEMHPAVINGASDLMVAVFGEAVGKHARAAVGAPSLPFNVAVEVEAVFEIA